MTKLQKLRNKANKLRMLYLCEKNVKNATQILLDRSATMEQVHQTQDEILALFFYDLKNDTTSNTKEAIQLD